MAKQREGGISWTDQTWNPIRGCSRVSEGCRHCYAEHQAARFSGPGQPYEGLVTVANGHPQWTGTIAFVEKHLLDPLKWKQPRRIFVNSMSDLFHENVTDEMRHRIFGVMQECPHHTFQILTKRPAGMLAFAEAQMAGGFCWPLPNAWLGVSVENQKAADERIPLLLQTPAAVRFVSCEPLLGPVGLANHFPHAHGMRDDRFWVICGGESGPGARPMDPDWARSLRDQCQASGVSFFMKQMGSVFGPKKGHDIPDDLNIRQFPEAQEGER